MLRGKSLKRERFSSTIPLFGEDVIAESFPGLEILSLGVFLLFPVARAIKTGHKSHREDEKEIRSGRPRFGRPRDFAARENRRPTVGVADSVLFPLQQRSG